MPGRDAAENTTRLMMYGVVDGVVVIGLAWLQQREREAESVQVTASSSGRVSSATVIVTARARKKLPVTPATAMSGRNTTTGVIVEPTRGREISCSALRTDS